MTPDRIFELGETWKWIIQDYMNTMFPLAPPAPFDSLGIASQSPLLPLTGSILGVVPIPSTVWLLGSGLIGIVGIRKKFKK